MPSIITPSNMGKTRNLFFYSHFYLELCNICGIYFGGIYLYKVLLHHFICIISIFYTPYENKCFNPRNQNPLVAFVTGVIPFAYRRITRYVMFTCIKYESTRVIAERAINLLSSNEWAEFWPEPKKFLVDMLNHAYNRIIILLTKI